MPRRGPTCSLRAPHDSRVMTLHAPPPALAPAPAAAEPGRLGFAPADQTPRAAAAATVAVLGDRQRVASVSGAGARCKGWSTVKPGQAKPGHASPPHPRWRLADLDPPLAILGLWPPVLCPHPYPRRWDRGQSDWPPLHSACCHAWQACYGGEEGGGGARLLSGGQHQHHYSWACRHLQLAWLEGQLLLALRQQGWREWKAASCAVGVLKFGA